MTEIHKSTPEDRLAKERQDCTVCALTHVLDLSYQACYAIAQKAGRQDNKGMVSAKLVGELRRMGYTLTQVEIPRLALTTAAIGYCFPEGIFYMHVKGHAFAVKDGKILDNGGLKKIAFLTGVYRLDSKPEKVTVVMTKETRAKFALDIL